LVFGREPSPGRAKTRLIPTLGPDGAAQLYERLLRHALTEARQIDVERRELWLDRIVGHSPVSTFANGIGFRLRAQEGVDLGERMHHALNTALSVADQTILIGSDCPGLDKRYLSAAFAALDRHDGVIGPATDGGYVLIGIKAPAPALFHGIDWGTSTVLAETRKQFTAAGLTWQELTPLPDVDEPADLVHVPADLLNPPSPQPSPASGRASESAPTPATAVPSLTGRKRG
jgi:rSAM/selenodomain-associated transferase 1